jgi:hypothetical protein
MKALANWSLAPSLNVIAVEWEESRWLVGIFRRQRACCPACGGQSRSHHSFYSPKLGDLPRPERVTAMFGHLGVPENFFCALGKDC